MIQLPGIEHGPRRCHERGCEVAAQALHARVLGIERRRSVQVGSGAIPLGRQQLTAPQARLHERQQAIELARRCRRLGGRSRRDGGCGGRRVRLRFGGRGRRLRSRLPRDRGGNLRIQKSQAGVVGTDPPHAVENVASLAGRIGQQRRLGARKQRPEHGFHPGRGRGVAWIDA